MLLEGAYAGDEDNQGKIQLAEDQENILFDFVDNYQFLEDLF